MKFYSKNLQDAYATNQIESIETAKYAPKIWTIDPIPSPASISVQNLVPSKSPPLAPQLAAVMVSSWPTLVIGASLGFITPALPLLRDPEVGVPEVTEDVLSWMASLTMLGALVGAGLSGPCLSLGRRTTLWLVSFPLAASWAGLALAHAPWPLLLTHMMFGLCMGVIGDAGQLYVNEVSHPSHRGALSCVPALMFSAGTLACYGTSIFFSSWRQMAYFGFTLSIPGLLLPAAIPESPSYLASRKNSVAALKSLQRLRGSQWDALSELADFLRLRPVATCWRGRLPELWAARRPVCVVGMVRVSSRLCGLRAVMAFLEPILAGGQSSVDSGTATVVAGVLQLVATLAACILLDKCGRRLFLVASQVAMAAALVGLAYGPGGQWPLALLGVYVVANSVGLGPVSGLLLGEMVAQKHRSVAASLTGMMSWVAAFLVTKTFFDLERFFEGVGPVLCMYAVFCVVGAAAAALWVPETQGVSLLQIEQQQCGRTNLQPNNAA